MDSNPSLPGEPVVDWDGQTGPTYFTDIKFSDVCPTDTSYLVGSSRTLGAGFDDNFLTTGTKWSTNPTASIWHIAAQESNWDVGAITVNGDITPPAKPTGLVINE